MLSKTIIRKNTYYDSATLMSAGNQIKANPGILEAVVAMATEMNKEILAQVGLADEATQSAQATDFLIAIRAEDEASYNAALELLEEKLAKGAGASSDSAAVYKTIQQVAEERPGTNVALISLPGNFAAREAMRALKNGMHVMLFSDNVTVEEERELKEFASANGLLMMGPDCGTAAINGVGLCFANEVRPGNIGIVAASGTGLQEVMVQIDHMGGGVAQALGTGGRDLSEAVGGIMMLDGIKALMEESKIEVICLVSKPPAPVVEEKIFALLEQTDKPVVVCFLEGSTKRKTKANIHLCTNLYEAALKSVSLAGIPVKTGCGQTKAKREAEVMAARSLLKPNQKYLRGFFCGGTLCAESLAILRPRLDGLKSNTSKHAEEAISKQASYTGNILLDMGDDEFTSGQPHPMIEPALRNDIIEQQGKNPEVGVVLLDFEIGYGSHDNPVGETIASIRRAKEEARSQGRELVFVSYICGTDKDKQNLAEQQALLLAEGVILAGSNKEAAEIAADILA